MGRNEVTVSSYLRYVGLQREAKAQPSVREPSAPLQNKHWNSKETPIVNVRWAEAAAYCTWAGGSLPTEAEWEFAYRAGKDGEIYPGGENSLTNARDHVNFYGTQGNDTWDQEPAPVRKFDANSLGLFDMAGNVWEWTADYYSKTAYAAQPEVDPQGPAQGKERVIRGGGYDAGNRHLRLSYRRGNGSSGPEIGFRCVLEDDLATRKIIRDPTRP